MEFKEDYVYDAPIAKVWEMFSNPDYSKLRAQKLMMTGPEVQNVAGSDDIQVKTIGGIPQDMLPPAAKRFVSPSTKAVIAEEWHREGPGRVIGALSVTGQGIPAALKARVSLTAEGNKTRAVMTGDLSIHIPLLGKRLEKEAIGFAPELVKGERETAAEFLAKNN